MCLCEHMCTCADVYVHMRMRVCIRVLRTYDVIIILSVLMNDTCT